MNLMHLIFLELEQNFLFVAPLREPSTVVDLCTGTGIWAINFSRAFPRSTVYGTDIAPVQPDMVPPNLQFMMDDVNNSTWFCAPGSVDYFHLRDAGVRDWLATLREAHRCLAPGGLLEAAVFLEPDTQVLPSEWQHWLRLLFPSATALRADLIRTAKFRLHAERRYSLPLGARAAGGHSSNIGTCLLEALLDRIHALDNYLNPHVEKAARDRMLNRLRMASQTVDVVL
ncbi:UbiE/COQ5 methyltransferase [Niveomyces insectorum RCEF 264]|uniref:UbiE/COQ5 methyltransferase n=1 Tax=Niveomyces insectorum RCEF 264 TaxID=1081102 RepID=A0A167ZW76_9HYPO|nr:UbiE/COQ5 methyltransferase [Niveomyces insectorum RCEF 264]